MKKALSIILASTLPFAGMAQFTDDFESYNAGDYLAQVSPVWTTWSGTTGGNEDVKIVTTKASSGTKSVYFSSTATAGGPQDVVLPFGAKFATGVFTFKQDMFIETGKGAYLNFQAETTLAQLWALNVHFIQDGKLYLSGSDDVTELETTFPINQWFEFKLVVKLNTNDWELFIDNSSKGSFQNLDNSIASLDIFPLNQAGKGGNSISGFWVDDCDFSHVPYTLPLRNAAISRIDISDPIIAGSPKEPVIQVRNLGQSTITSFDIAVTYNGVTKNKSITGITLDSLETYNVSLGSVFTIASGVNSISATVSNVNGQATDNDATDNTKTVTFKSIIPAPGKLVIVEEATGTWCGWCPRGTVAMEFLQRDYQGLAHGIAVHNNDPMAFEKYDAGMGTKISGYPSALVDRGLDVDPSAIWEEVGQRLQTPPAALLEAGALYNSTTGQLDISIEVDFQAAVSGDWRIACILTEDSVSGTDAGYAQSNYYKSNNQDLFNIYGQNWKTFPNPVPASQMVYNHVARALTPSFDGQQNSFPTSVTAGSKYVFNFIYNVASYDVDNVHIAGILIGNDKRIDNATAAAIDEAVQNGFKPGQYVVSTTLMDDPGDDVKIYPNPSSQAFVNLLLESSEGDEVVVEVMDHSARLVYKVNHGEQTGPVLMQLPTREMEKGLYIVRVTIGDRLVVRKLIIE